MHAAFIPDWALLDLPPQDRRDLMACTVEAVGHSSGAANVTSGFVQCSYSITRMGWAYEAVFASNAWTGRSVRLSLPHFRFGPVRFTGTPDAFTLIVGPVVCARLNGRWLISVGRLKIAGIGRRLTVVVL